MRFSGKTRVYGVIGDPIEHSLSPAMHNAAFQATEMDCVFLAFRVRFDAVQNALRGMRGLEICGLNVTMPHKETVISWLDAVEENAKTLGSVNTILNDSGKLRGYSTDGFGALNALKANGADPSGKKVLLLGAGGAAKAIAFALGDEVNELILLNRTIQKTIHLLNVLQGKFGKKVNAGSLSIDSLQRNLQNTDILINATSVGMSPKSELSLVNSELIRKNMVVMDLVYNPLETELVKNAKAKGAKVVSGLEMLIYQGAASFEIWTGKAAPIEVMRKAALKQLKKVGNS